MKRMLFVLVGVFALVIFGSSLARAENEPMNETVVTEGGNAICLCGMAVKAGEGTTVEYEGKTYTFCSKGCADAFNKDPKAAIEKMSAAAAVTEKADVVEDAMDDAEDEDYTEEMNNMDEMEGEEDTAPAVEQK